MPISTLPWLSAIALAMYARSIQRHVAAQPALVSAAINSFPHALRKESQKPSTNINILLRNDATLTKEEFRNFIKVPEGQNKLKEFSPDLITSLQQKATQGICKHNMSGGSVFTNDLPYFAQMKGFEKYYYDWIDRFAELNVVEIAKFVNKIRTEFAQRGMELVGTPNIPRGNKIRRNKIAHGIELLPCLRLVELGMLSETMFELFFCVSSEEARRIHYFHFGWADRPLSLHANHVQWGGGKYFVNAFSKWLREMRLQMSQMNLAEGHAEYQLRALAQDAFKCSEWEGQHHNHRTTTLLRMTGSPNWSAIARELGVGEKLPEDWNEKVQGKGD